MRKIVSSFILLLVFSSVFSQENIKENHSASLFESALDLFTKEKYTASKREFQLYVLDNKGLRIADAEFYIAHCTLEIGQEDEAKELFEAFLKKHPAHPKSHFVYYELGQYFYNKPDYEQAIKNYELASFKKLKRDEEMTAYFNLGYSYFIVKNYDKAEPLFDRVKRYDNQYTYAANYYSGFIKYKQKDFEQAILDFKVAEQNASYETVVPFMLTNIYYQQGNYDLVVEYAGEVLKSKKRVQKKNDLVLLLADAHYNKKEYKESEKLFSLLLAQKSGSDRGLLYRYAYSSLKVDKKDKAITEFSKVASTEDSIGQYAAFYLGQLYLEKGKKEFAKNSFEQAAKSDFDLDIQELSAFNTAKLHFELKYFRKTLLLLKDFEEKYPNSKYNNELKELMTECYLHSQNYKSALSYIESLSRKTTRINKVYQQVAFLKAVDLYNSKNFGPAILYFDKSLQFDFDMKVYNQALFWKAETLSMLYQWKEARKIYSLLISSNAKGTEFYVRSLYSRGYTFYNEKDFSSAQTDFKTYVHFFENKKSKAHYDDALLRLADCFYSQKQWGNAISNYEKAIAQNVKNKDYAYLKLGESKAINSDVDGALSSYDKLIFQYPNSIYWSKAVYKKGIFAYQKGKYELAIKEITRFIEAKPKDEHIADLLMKRGNSLKNIGEYEKALIDFDLILKQHCLNRQVSEDAFILVRETLSKLNREKEIEEYLETMMACNPDSSKLVQYKYDIALGFYNERKFEEAIGYFERFEKAYPENDYKVELHYYMANCYYQLDRKKEAIDYYAKEVNYGRNKYYEISLLRLNKLLVDYDDPNQKIKYNKLLVKYASDVKHLLKAYESLMDTYYESGQYDSSNYYAKQVLSQENFVVNLENKATLIHAKSLYMLEDTSCIQVFDTLHKSASNEYGAEANYFLAKIAREKGDYEKSQNLAVTLKDQYSSFEYWVGKAFLLISENYIDLGEEFQASSTLQSIIDYFPIEEIVQEAKEIKATIDDKSESNDNQIDVEQSDSLNVEEEEEY